MFSKNKPNSIQKETVRDIEKITTSATREENNFDIESFYRTKLTDVKEDNVQFKLEKDDNSTLKIDIAHIPAAIGVLFGRLIYPSYGFMLICSRLANLLFFTVCLFFVIKYSTVGKWSLVMLFSVPFLQKLASPSYDVFAYVAITAFAINMLNLAKITSFKTLTRKQILYTLLTIILILLSKNNYVFILLTLFILPMFTTPIFTIVQKNKVKYFFGLYWLY